jgi:hypothetical protein
VSLPGPAGTLWAVELLVFGAAAGVVGEAVRRALASVAPVLATVDPFERGLIDLYLGGGLLYLVAWVPPGLFYSATFPVVVLLAVLALWASTLRRAGSLEHRPTLPAGFHIGWRSLALASGLVLFLVETLVAASAPTGNTFDSSLFTDYAGLLVAHHTLPTTLAPLAAQPLPYPQGATVWFATAQLLFALPPARTALLVTPLFLGLAPVAGFVLGRRWWARESAGAAVALSLALLASWTRVLVSGSNDFVLAFPLALLLMAWTPGWWRPQLPGWGSTLGFGVMAGVLASLSPVAAEVVLGAAVVGRVLLRPPMVGAAREWAARWAARWVAAVGVTALSLAPAIYIELDRASNGVAGTGSWGAPYGVPGSELIGLVDPFLFRSSDVALSPFPWLRLELVVLLVVGIVGLIAWDRGRPEEVPGPGPGTALLALGSAAVLGLLLEWAASSGNPLLDVVARWSSPTELSILLFTVFGILAAVPLVALFHSLEEGEAIPDPGPSVRWLPRSPTGPEGRALVALVALAILLPGIAVTATSFPSYLSTEYGQFGNVSAGDFALLEWGSSHLPAGARVLVAPGSSGQFLPGYNPRVVVLFPVTVFGESTNSDYQRLLHELPNATLDSAGTAALTELGVGYVVVTGGNTVIWPPFSPVPLEAAPSATLEFHDGDAYVFAWNG